MDITFRPGNAKDYTDDAFMMGDHDHLWSLDGSSISSNDWDMIEMQAAPGAPAEKTDIEKFIALLAEIGIKDVELSAPDNNCQNVYIKGLSLKNGWSNQVIETVFEHGKFSLIDIATVKSN